MRYLKIFLSVLACAISVLCVAQSSNSYTVDKGIIYCEKGIPESPRWFADNRLAFQFEEGSITQVDYYNAVPGQPLATLFLKQLWDGFRYYLEQDNKTFKPDYTSSRIWPFGIESEWNFQNAIIKHRVMAVDESIVIQVEMPQYIPAGLRFKVEFFEAFALTKGSVDDLRFSTGGTTRRWDPWRFSATSNSLAGGMTSYPETVQDKPRQEPFQTRCLIGADFPVEHSVRLINSKHILTSPTLDAGKTYSFIISFGQVEDALREKNNRMVTDLSQHILRQFERYRKVAEHSPVLKSDYTYLNNFISLAPMYHESLKITDHPGAMRAKTSNYWVWGWDGMTSNYATAYWGDVEHIKGMLKFYDATADSQKGIAHAYGFNLIPSSFSALPAQGMYITLLQLYYANTGDIQYVKERYPFAKTIFNSIARSEVKGTGFCKGTSLFPDFPEAMSETGNDISGFNNTIFYCSARSMESLAAVVGDKEQQKKALDIVRKFERNFLSLFFNPEKKFVVSSIDSETLSQRDSYNTNSIRWENNYCADITDSIGTASLEFFKQNAVTPMGLREIPLWNKSYDMDANQLHCWWPVTGEYFMRLINGNDEKPLVEQWIKWVSYWSKNLTCPEGISYYIETDEPEFDRWTSQKGTWQGYSIRGWYQAALHGVVGVETDAGGITFYPYSGEEMTLEGLNFRNKRFDIEMKGSGPFIESVEANGIVIKGTNKLPTEVYKDKPITKVIVHRVKANPHPISITSGTGVALQVYRYDKGTITATLSGAGLCRLKMNANRPPKVKLAGKNLPVIYDQVKHTAYVELNLKPGELKKIEIK